MSVFPVAEQHRVAPGIPRLLASSDAGYAAHLRTYGPLPAPRDLVAELTRSGLTGRGGAAFPAARKLAATARHGVVIGNGSEGEPFSAKDELLLRARPHLVLDGLLTVATAVEAKAVHLVVGPQCEAAVRSAMAERTDARRVRLTVAQDRFVGGEASAVVNLLTSGRAVPEDRPVRLTTRGLRGRSTLVQNVETLAHVALIARYGAERYRDAGASWDPGTRLFSISGDVAHPGVTEAPGGSTLRSVLRAASPGPVSGVLVGGYHGVWVGGADLDRPLAPTAAACGIPVGAGILIVVGPQTCGLRTAAEIARYLATESAGQCGPCVNGLPDIATTFERMADGDQDVHLPARMERMAGLVTGRGACHHPDGTARMVRSALRLFADEAEAHRHGRCTAAGR